jgi:hypothetical protein
METSYEFPAGISSINREKLLKQTFKRRIKHVFYMEYSVCKPHIMIVNHTEVCHVYTLELVRP